MLMCGQTLRCENNEFAQHNGQTNRTIYKQNKHWINQPPEIISNVWEYVFFGKWNISQRFVILAAAVMAVASTWSFSILMLPDVWCTLLILLFRSKSMKNNNLPLHQLFPLLNSISIEQQCNTFCWETTNTLAHSNTQSFLCLQSRLTNKNWNVSIDCRWKSRNKYQITCPFLRTDEE